MCTWIMCTWRLNLLLHILQVHCVKCFISRSFYSLARAAFYSSRRPSRMRRPHIIVTYSSAAVNKETIKPTRLTTACTCVRAIPLSPWVYFEHQWLGSRRTMMAASSITSSVMIFTSSLEAPRSYLDGILKNPSRF